MSHCRFENTLKDLNDCINNLDNIQSKSELEAAKSLMATCKEIGEDMADEELEISAEKCEGCREELEKCRC